MSITRALLAQETVRPGRDRRFPSLFIGKIHQLPSIAGERQKRRFSNPSRRVSQASVIAVAGRKVLERGNGA